MKTRAHKENLVTAITPELVTADVTETEMKYCRHSVISYSASRPSATKCLIYLLLRVLMSSVQELTSAGFRNFFVSRAIFVYCNSKLVSKKTKRTIFLNTLYNSLRIILMAEVNFSSWYSKHRHGLVE